MASLTMKLCLHKAVTIASRNLLFEDVLDVFISPRPGKQKIKLEDTKQDLDVKPNYSLIFKQIEISRTQSSLGKKGINSVSSKRQVKITSSFIVKRGTLYSCHISHSHFFPSQLLLLITI